MRTEIGYDLMKAALSTDKARTILAALEIMLNDGVLAEKYESELALAAAGTHTATIPFATSDFDLIFVFANEECTLELVSGDSRVLEKDGILLFRCDGLAYFKVTMGSTAGSVAFLLAR